MTKRHFFLRLLSVLVCAVMLSGFFSYADAAQTKQLSISFTAVTYQNRVRDLLKSINRYRSDNGVAPLTFSADLEEAALQRAGEIFVLFDHRRPDMTDFDTVIADYPELAGGGYICELIGTDFSKADDLFASWTEEYSTVLLDGDYTHAGIGCVYVKNSNNEYYWAMILQQQPDGFNGKTAASSAKAGKNKTIHVAIDPAMYSAADHTHVRFELDANNLNLKNKSTGRPTVYLYDRFDVKIGKCDLSTLTFKSNNPSIFTVDSTGTVKKKKNGTGTLTISSEGLSDITCTVTISGSASAASSTSSSGSVTASTIGDAEPILTLKEYSKHKVLSVYMKGSSGYVIYRSTTKTGSYTKVDEVSSTKRWNYRIDNEDISRTYYYKVRAFKNSGGKRIYSLYSEPVKVEP